MASSSPPDSDTPFAPHAPWLLAPREGDPPVLIDDLVMAWARDKDTGVARYIGELGPEHRGAKCNCVCYSCNLALQAVNAGVTTYKRRPHFRHPNGAVKDDCLVLTARAAALETWKKDGLLILPRRRYMARMLGLSGNYHEAWAEAPAETVKVARFDFRDQTYAIVTLDDGREIKVILEGRVAVTHSEAGTIGLIPTIILTVSDPAIAALSPAELRKRLTIIVEEGQWCSHWADAQLQADALALATQGAIDALDWLPDGVDIDPHASDDERRETLLHQKAKEILARECSIRLPDLQTTAECVLPSGKPINRHAVLPGVTVELERVELEKSMGAIRPDVVAQTRATGRWPAGPLLIEITVTNTIREARRARIAATGLPALEIDISRLGGKVTEAEFARLVVTEVAGKRWLYHPMASELRAEAQTFLDRYRADWLVQEKRLGDQRAEQIRLAQIRQIPVGTWREEYLESVKHYATCRAAFDATGLGLHKVLEAEEALKTSALALREHGYPEAREEFLYRQKGCMLERLLSLKEDRSMGQQPPSAWPVIESIMMDRDHEKQWHSIYLIAIRIYDPSMTQSQLNLLNAWRDEVGDSLRAGESTFQRDRKYDRLLSLLFPLLARRLALPLGPEPRPPPAYSRPPVRSGDYGRSLYLAGDALERWRQQNPEAAAHWDAAQRNK